VAFPKLTIEPIVVVVREWKLRGNISWPSVMVKRSANVSPHPECIDVMEGAIMDE